MGKERPVQLIIIDERPELLVAVEEFEAKYLPPAHPKSLWVRRFCLLGFVAHLLFWVVSMVALEEIRARKIHRTAETWLNSIRIYGEIIEREKED